MPRYPLTSMALVLVLLLLLSAASPAGAQSWTVTDPENDQVLCADGSPGPTGRGSIDIVQVSAERSGDYVIYQVVTRDPISGGETIAGGVEHWVPPPFAPQPNPNPNWLPDNFGTASHNGVWGPNGTSASYAIVDPNGNWTQVSTVSMVSRDGATITFMIPVFEHPEGGFIVFTITDFYVNSSQPTCDFVGLGDNGYPTFYPPSFPTVTDLYTYNGNTPIIIPASGVLGNDAEGCQNTVLNKSGLRGAVDLNSDGSFTYTPRAGDYAPDGFHYTATCGGQSGAGLVSLFPIDPILYGDVNAPPGGDGTFDSPYNALDEVFEKALSILGPGAIRLLGGEWTGGALTVPDGIIVSGSGSTVDLSQYGLDVAPFAVDQTVEGHATITLSPEGAIHLGKDNTLVGIDLNPTGGGTAMTGIDVGSLTIEDVTISGDGHALDVTEGLLNMDLPSIETSSFITNTISLNGVKGSADIGSFSALDGASGVSSLSIRNSPDLNLFIGNVDITNSGGGILFSDAGTVTISGGSVKVGAGPALSVDNTQLFSTFQDITSSLPITNTIQTTDVGGSLTVDETQIGGSSRPYAISIKGGDADYSFGTIDMKTAGGGIYVDFEGTLNIDLSTMDFQQMPAIDLTGGTYDTHFEDIRQSRLITSTISPGDRPAVSLTNGAGSWRIDRMDVLTNSTAPIVRIDNTSGIIQLDNVKATNGGGDAIVVESRDGSFQISNSDLSAAGDGIYLPLIGKNRSPGKSLAAASAPDFGLVVEDNKITVGTGYAVEVASDDPAELSVAIQGNTLSGGAGEISLSELDGGNITLANFQGGDADAVVAFLQAANEGEPRVNVVGEIGAGVDITAVEEASDAIPTSMRLGQNFPNPFNPSTTIEFDIPETEFTELAVYNLSGQKVAILYRGELAAGTYSMTWNAAGYAGRNLASGVYVYRLEAGGVVASRTLTLLK